MGKTQIIIFSLLCLSNSLSAQVVYDTIPEKPESLRILSGGGWYFPTFKNIDSQLNDHLKNIDFQNANYRSGTVVVSTIFGKNGKQLDTKIIKPLSPYCDSIAFNALSGLDNWVPAMSRAHFVDYELLYPIHFPNEENPEENYPYFSGFNDTPAEYESAKWKFDFYYSTDLNQKLPFSFQYLKDYIADELSDSTYVYLSEFGMPKKENRVKIEVVNRNAEKIPFLIRDPTKNWLLFYTQPQKKIYLEKEKKYQIIGFMPLNREAAILSIDNVEFENDTLFTPDFKYSTKPELLREINNF